MKKIIFGLFILAFLAFLMGCAPAEKKAGEIFEIKCGQTRAVDLSCTTDADCAIENIESFCSPDGVTLPTCGPTPICDVDNICKAQCSVFP